MNIRVTVEYEINGKRVIKTAEATDVSEQPSQIGDNRPTIEEETARNLFAAIERREHK